MAQDGLAVAGRREWAQIAFLDGTFGRLALYLACRFVAK